MLVVASHKHALAVTWPKDSISLGDAHITQEVSFSTTDWNSSDITWAEHQSNSWPSREAFPF